MKKFLEKIVHTVVPHEKNRNVPHLLRKEFIAVLKKNPGKFNYSSSGTGSTQHLSGEMLKLMINTDIVHVPYKARRLP